MAVRIAGWYLTFFSGLSVTELVHGWNHCCDACRILWEEKCSSFILIVSNQHNKKKNNCMPGELWQNLQWSPSQHCRVQIFITSKSCQQLCCWLVGGIWEQTTSCMHRIPACNYVPGYEVGLELVVLTGVVPSRKSDCCQMDDGKWEFLKLIYNQNDKQI